MKKIKVFETFAGIGAQHKALEILLNNNIMDYEIVGTSEWDIWANISYHSIHNEGKNIASKLNEEEIDNFLEKFTLSNDSKTPATKTYIKKLPRITKELLYSSMKLNNNLGSILEINGQEMVQKSDFDLLTYSFPCQDLSNAGNFHNSEDKVRGMKKGSGTRSGLLWQIERVLKDLKKINKLPKYLLLENVKAMLSKNNMPDYEKWIEFLHDELGYDTQTYVLNSKEHGAAQSRERVYALSVLNGEDKFGFRDTFSNTMKIVETDENNLPKTISKEIKINKTLKDVIKDNYKNQIYLEEAISSTPNWTKSRKQMYFDNPLLVVNGEIDLGSNKTLKSKSNKNVNKKENIDKYKKKSSKYYASYSRTVTTKQDRNPNAGIIDIRNSIVEEKIRKNPKKRGSLYRLLSPREAFILMGFEEKDYEKVISKKDLIKKEKLYRQAGNSIVVNVLVDIFKKISEIEKGDD